MARERRSTFHKDFTYLAPDGAAYLVSIGVRLVGVDYLSVEQFHSADHRTHRTLLENGIVIVEGLVLSAPPPGDYDLYCLPLLLAGLDGAPARAVLLSVRNDGTRILNSDLTETAGFPPSAWTSLLAARAQRRLGGEISPPDHQRF